MRLIQAGEGVGVDEDLEGAGQEIESGRVFRDQREAEEQASPGGIEVRQQRRWRGLVLHGAFLSEGNPGTYIVTLLRLEENSTTGYDLPS
jgi:hypothetical protein